MSCGYHNLSKLGVGGFSSLFKSSNLVRCFGVSSVLNHSNKLWQEPDPEKRGIKLYDIKDGTRGEYKDGVDRFKRLDWGHYIHPRSGRHRKMYKRTDKSRWDIQQHVFAADSHRRNLDFMFGPKTKEKRYLPNDIYDKYNATSFHKMWCLKHKNSENIKKYGSDIYKFNRFKAHLSNASKYNKQEKRLYEPPGFYGDIAAGNEVYRPTEIIPEVVTPPHFQRDPIQTKGRAKALEKIRFMDEFTKGEKLRPWSPILYTTLWDGSNG